MADKTPFHVQVAERLIEQLKQGTAPWQLPWKPGEPGGNMPINPTTNKRYRGINAINLMCAGYEDKRWLTYKQASAIGAQVRRGQHGTLVQYWKFTEEQDRVDKEGKPVLDEKGNKQKVQVKLERPRVFYATVFNAEQIDGMPPIQKVPETSQTHQWQAHQRAESILENMREGAGVKINHDGGRGAFYRPLTDSIHLPAKEQFETADNYYATALHELGHATGHSARLNRDLAHPFGSEGYAKEELRAEIASMILGDELGIGHDPGQHAAYVGSWIKALQNDPLEIFRAAADAEKIQEFVLAYEQKLEQVQQEENVLQQSEKWPETPLMSAAWNLPENNARDLDSRNLVSELITPELEKIADARREGRADVMGELLRNSFGADFVLPDSWTGTVQIRGLIEQNGFISDAFDVEPKLYGVFAEGGDDFLTLEMVASFDSREQAEQLAEKLSLVDALSETNGNKQAAKFARINEMSVRNDPGSTEDDILAAKEVRKSAEYQVMQDAEQRVQREMSVKPDTSKIYLDVPYKDKDEAKSLGAKWDRQERAWFVPADSDMTAFSKWTTTEPVAKKESPAVEKVESQKERQYLAVAYEDRGAAKAAGAKWDKEAKSWYVGEDAAMDKLARWLPENVPNQQGPAMTPEQEFADALRSIGCVVDEPPEMDGKKHRIATEGDKRGEKSGFYVGHLDGRPAGYMKNNRTGAEVKWVSKGYTLDPEQKAKLQAEAAEKKQAREEERKSLQEAASIRVSQQLGKLVAATESTPYLQSKGIQHHIGAFTDKEGQKTYLPAFDTNNKLWTMQYINEDGTKRFAKDSHKEGCFHPVGGIEAVSKAPALVIAEGYATAATLAESLGYATVAAFDSGNLGHVAKALHEKYPDKPIIIAGDDDTHLMATQGVNPGRSKAQEAAQAVNGVAVFPVFAPGEQEGNAKGFTDFNDLANKSSLGKEGVERQIKAVVERKVEQHKEMQQAAKVERQMQQQRKARSA